MVIKTNPSSNVADINIGPLQLTSGHTLDEVVLRYERVGPKDGPVILVCHALTGNHLTVGTKTHPGWWSSLINDGKYIDTQSYQVITFNVLGGCDGSTGPTSTNPKTGLPYQASFPEITVQDIIKAQYKALKQLNINKLYAIIGGSLGGMQVFEWGLCYPEMIHKLIILATTSAFSDYGIAFNHIAEAAIKNDPHWNNGFYQKEHHLSGLEIARMIGMVTYRSSDLFTERFKREKSNNQYHVTSYLDYQGIKLRSRFDANSYLRLLHAMNQHDISESFGSMALAYQTLSLPTLMLSFDKDLIYEPLHIKTCAEQLPNCIYHHVETNFGHDGFLVEFEKWGGLIKHFLSY